MRVYNNSVVLRNDGVDPSTSNADLNAALGVNVTVRVASTPTAGLGALASIFNIADVAIANPMQTDDKGNYRFKVVDGVYDVVIAEGTADEAIISSEEIIEFDASTNINDLSLPYVFDTVAAMVDSTIVFPVGKEISVKSRNAGNRDPAIWDVFTGLTDNGRDILDTAAVGLQVKERPKNNITYYDKISEMVLYEATAYINKKIYVRQVSTYYNMQSTGTVYDVACGALFAVAVNVELNVNELPANKMLNDFNRGVASKGNTTLTFIGDSILNGTGALDWDTESAVLTDRSIQNAIGKSAGYGITSYMAGYVDKLNSGVDGTGSFVSDGGGPVEQAYKLDAGEYVRLTGRNFNQLRMYYTGSLTTGSVSLDIDGAIVEANVSLSGTGAMDTVKFATVGVYIQRTSEVKIIADSGSTVYITGVEPIRESGGSNAPVIFYHAYPAKGIQHFAQQVIVDDLASMANVGPYGSGSGSTNQCFLLSIGTNNIYNPTQDLSPVDMIAQYQLFVDRIETACTNASFAVAITPQANENVQTPILAFTYWQYQEALIDWCEANDYPMIRNDLLLNSKRGFMVDELHPNDTGHAAIANLWCKYFNFAMNPYKYMDQMETTNDLTIRSGITFNSTWAAVSGANPTFYMLNNILYWSGRISRGGSASSLVGTLSSEYHWPKSSKKVAVFTSTKIIAFFTIGVDGTITSDNNAENVFELDGATMIIDTSFIP